MSRADLDGAAASRRPGALSEVKRRLLRERLAQRGLVSDPAQPIPRRDPSAPVPLSYNQEGLWFIEQAIPGLAAYEIPCAVTLSGALDLGALRRALTEIVTRHQVLRSVVVVDATGRPHQHYRPIGDLPVPLEDLSHVDIGARAGVVRERLEAAVRTPLDLSAGPLFTTAVFRFAPTEHVLVFKVHHLVCDGWSMGVLTRELAALYEAFLNGRPSSLPPLPVQYGDYAIWERDTLRGSRLARHVTFWREQLGDEPPVLRLPTDGPRPTVPTFRGRHHPIGFDERLTGGVSALSRRGGVTAFHTLLGAFSVLLYCVTGQTQIVVGTTFANRVRRELDGLIGYFVNTLPVRTDLSANPRFGEIQTRARDATLAVAQHQELPLTLLVKEWRLERSLAQNPLFQVVFYYLTLDHNPAVYGFGISPVGHKVAFSGLTLAPVDFDCGLARFDIAVLLWDMPDGLRGTIEYSTDLFRSSTIARLAERYAAIVRRIVDQPDIRLHGLVAMDDDDQRQHRAARETERRADAHRSLNAIRKR